MNFRNSSIVSVVILALGVTGFTSLSAQTWKGTTSDWSTATNWHPTGVPAPTSSGTATFKNNGSTTVTFSADASVGTVKFINGAPAYTFTVSGHSFTLLGDGIDDNSSNAPTFNVTAGLTFKNSAGAADAIINNNLNGETLFYNTSSAQTALITNNPGGATIFHDSSTAGKSTINTAGTTAYFDDSSTAGQAILNNSFNGNIGGAQFSGTSTAGKATITNTGGYTAFLGTSDAGSANITNNIDGSSNQGVTDFYNSGNAKNSTILNENGAVTYFYNTSKGGSANITNQNGGYTNFEDSSEAGSVLINSNDGATFFSSSARAHSATIINVNGSTLSFGDNSDAGTATISNNNSVTTFSGTATANAAQITNEANGGTYFFNTTSGGTARFINEAGGTLDISSLTSNGTQVGTIEGAGDIMLGSKELTIVGRSDNVATVYSGIISNGGIAGGKKGSLTINSTGTLTLSGSNTYSGETTLDNGTLIAANSQAFGIGGFKLKNGTLETDDTNHLIAIGKDFNQTGGTLMLNLNALPGSASNDMVSVNGTAKLNGTLFINYTGPVVTPTQPETYIVVATTGGVTSAGAGYTSPDFQSSNMGAVTLSITGTTVGNDFDVILSSTQNSFNTLVGTNFTSNQQHVSDYLNRFITTTTTGPVIPLIQALDILSVNPADLGPAFDQLTPIKFGSFASTTAFNNSAFLTQQFDSYLASHRGADGSFVSSSGGIDYSGLVMNDPNTDAGLQSVRSHLLAWEPAANAGLISDSASLATGGVDMKDTKEIVAPGANNPWNVFVSGNVILAQDFSNTQAGLPFANTTTGAVQFGADYKLSPHWLVGAMFGFGHTEATLDAMGSNATVDTYSPAFYASYSENGWYANALASYGFASYSQTRQVNIGAFNGSANSSPGGDQIIGNLDGGYDFHNRGWTYGPTAGLGYTHLDVNGYSETGLPGADLTVSAQHTDSLRSRLGWGVSYMFRDAGLTFTPHLNASWQHEFFNQSRGITSQFSSVGAGSFVVNTAGTSRDSAIFDTGLDIEINDSLTAFFDYAAQAGQSNYFGQSIQGGFKIGF